MKVTFLDQESWTLVTLNKLIKFEIKKLRFQNEITEEVKREMVYVYKK